MARSNESQRFLDFWLGVPLVMVMARLRQRRSLPAAPKRIGFISPGAIGDLILESGILLHLHKTFPGAVLQVFHGTSNAGAIPLLPVTLRSHACNFSNVSATLGAIREAYLDVIVDPTSWPRLTALYCILSGAMTVGFHSDGQFRHYGFDIAVAHLRSRHEVENLRALAEVFAPCPNYRAQVRSDSTEPAISLPYPRLVLCHIGAGGSRAAEKAWPVVHWAELTTRLVADGFVVGFTGTKADVPSVASVLVAAALPAEAAFSLCGQLSLVDLSRLLRVARLLITIDTSVLHLASALNTPMVALHGPTHSWRWGPRSSAAISVDAPHAEAGYIHFGFEKNARGLTIMSRITVDSVYQAVKSALDRVAVTARARLPLESPVHRSAETSSLCWFVTPAWWYWYSHPRMLSANSPLSMAWG